jgi:hypothetical protein
MSDELGVVYLARVLENVSSMEAFVRSYTAHAAGAPHDLIVVYKGCEHADRLAAARSVFESLTHTAIELPDTGFDINAYLETARKVRHGHLCFLNTFTEIAADGWLAKLYRHGSAPGVGFAGAMGSYESLSDSMRLIAKVIYLCRDVFLPYDEMIAEYYGFVSDDGCRLWTSGRAEPRMQRRLEQAASDRNASPIAIALRSSFGRHLEQRFREKWRRRVRPGGELEAYGAFPAFPNPHVRSNGFLIDRSRLTEFDFGALVSKLDCCGFESGAASLTRRIRAAGLAAVVVGKDGRRYDVADWWKSGTFRLADQENLLLTDNQSRGWTAMSAGSRETHVRMTWGDYLGPAPKEYPALGFRFRVDRSVTG